MATIKSYTDINQSRKLAEFLPIESADMFYWCADHYPKEDWIIEVGELDDNYECICAWSLAALLNLIPEYIKFNGHIWKFYLDHCGMYYMNADTYDINTFSSSIGVLIDDAFEIILKLKEKNLL